MKRWQSLLLGVVVSVATLAYALHGNDLNQLGSTLLRGRYVYVIPCVALLVVCFVIRALRWRALLNYRLSTAHSFHIDNIGYFLNAWLPFRLGEVGRAFLPTRLNPPIAIFTALSSILLERLLDLLAVLVLLILAILIHGADPVIVSAAKFAGVVAIGGMLVLTIFAARPALAHSIVDIVLRRLPLLERFNIRPLVGHVLDGITALGSVQGVATTLFWTAILWTGSSLAGYILLFVYFDNPSWAAIFLVIGGASLAGAVPAVPGNVGPFEAATIAGLALGGMLATGAVERATAFAVLLHATGVITYSVLGWIGLGQEHITLGELIQAARQVANRSRDQSSATVHSATTDNPPTVPTSDPASTTIQP